jgi:hypothetical protein
MDMLKTLPIDTVTLTDVKVKLKESKIKSKIYGLMTGLGVGWHHIAPFLNDLGFLIATIMSINSFLPCN